MITETNDETQREMVITRTLDAPAELVWQAWTTPEHLAHWWGPDGFTITTESHEFKEGGVWKFTMHGPDGKNYSNKSVYREIDPPRKIVYSHGGASDDDDRDGVSFVSTITFAEKDGKTEVTMRSLFPSAEALQTAIQQYGALEGGKQHLASLARYVETLQE